MARARRLPQASSLFTESSKKHRRREKVRRADWAMLAIAAVRGKSISPLQLQKGLFVFQRWSNDPLENYYSFGRFRQGPFDSTIYRDVEALAREDLVTIRKAKGRGRWKAFEATEAGLRYAMEVEIGLPSRTRSLLRQTVSWMQEQRLSEIFRTIHLYFPEYRPRSISHR
jgi:hypothetical protein